MSTLLAVRSSVATKAINSYRPELDALRFCAFLAVFITHAVPPQVVFYRSHGIPEVPARMMSALVSAGAYGVTLFFMLSAYLITGLLIREVESTGTLRIKWFYVRRILRIWPLYFVALGLAVSFPLAAERLPWPNVWPYLVMAGNWVDLPPQAPGSWMAVLWSVSVEEQFYLLWPLVVGIAAATVAARPLKQKVLWIGILLIVAGNIARYLLGEQWHNTLVHLDAIGVGVALAVLPELRLTSGMKTALLFFALACALVAAPIHGNFLTFRAAAATLGCAAILFAVLAAKGIPPAPVIYLGRISYGLYVWHQLMLRLVEHAMGDKMLTVSRFVFALSVSLVVTIAVAALSHRFLELPFLRLKERFSVVRARPATAVPLFSSGREASDHGLREIKVPGRSARLMATAIRKKRRLSRPGGAT